MYKKQVEATKLAAVPATVDEQETIINISRTSDTVEIYTSDNTMITKLVNVMKLHPQNWKCFEYGKDLQGRVTGYIFECPKKAISFRSGSPVVRKKN